jgi:hypothetical protein
LCAFEKNKFFKKVFFYVEGMKWKMVDILAICPFGKLYGTLVHFMAIWQFWQEAILVYFPPFWYIESKKSGNPAVHSFSAFPREGE